MIDEILKTMRNVRCRPDQRGNALPAIIVVMVVLGIMAVAALRTTGDDRLAAHNVRENTRAFYAAEAGLNAVVANWDSLQYDTLMAAPGDSFDLGWQTLPDNGARYRAVIQRVDNGAAQVFNLKVAGRSSGARGGHQGLGVLLTDGIDISFVRGAVMTTNNMELVSDPTSTIDGNDTNPAGWACDPAGPGMPGVAVADMTGMSQGPGTILGSPPVTVDPTIDASTFTSFGGVSYADLVAMADISYPAGDPGSFGPHVVGPNCVYSTQSNWGDPLSSGPCADYFPIIHFAGNIEFTCTGCYGQGILLTDGDLHVGGGDFTFYGLIIVQGSCVFEYNSLVYGGIICANQFGANQEIGDAAPINYSSCALERAWGTVDDGSVAVVPGSWTALSM